MIYIMHSFMKRIVKRSKTNKREDVSDTNSLASAPTSCLRRISSSSWQTVASWVIGRGEAGHMKKPRY